MEGIIKKRLRYNLFRNFHMTPSFCDQRMICLNSTNISVILKEMNRKERDIEWEIFISLIQVYQVF